MSLPALPGFAGQHDGITSLPVNLDYPAALALRQMALVHDNYPKYLLAPEISALLHYVPDLQRKILFATLWNSGARINEALALTRGDFSLAPPALPVCPAGHAQATHGERLPKCGPVTGKQHTTACGTAF